MAHAGGFIYMVVCMLLMMKKHACFRSRWVFGLYGKNELNLCCLKKSFSSIRATDGLEKTGTVFKGLPAINPPDIYFQESKKSLRACRLDRSIKNNKKAHQKLSAQSFDTLMKSLNKPITESLAFFEKNINYLHPYEHSVALLTIRSHQKNGHLSLENLIVRLKALRGSTSRLCKEYAMKAKACASSVEAKDVLEEGLRTLEDFYSQSEESKVLIELRALLMAFRKIPVLDLSLPIMVLVGAPNVGKSSIVRAISTGTPEVNDYPFTTRGVTLGHIHLKETTETRMAKFQIMDSPGLLDRPDAERNEMERLTFASLAHLPSAVMFVIDPTGLSGEKSTLEAQLNVRGYLKERFPQRPWIDVVSKGDLPIPESIEGQLPVGYLHVSVKSGWNMTELNDRVVQKLHDLSSLLSMTQ